MKRNKLRIMYNGKQLQYKDKIKDYKLSEGKTVRLVNESSKENRKEEVKELVVEKPKVIKNRREIEEDKIQIALEFWIRIKEYLNQVENNTRDVGLYMGQSWNPNNLTNRTKVQIVFASELEENWKSIFKEATTMIEEAAPGIEFISLESSKINNQKNIKIIYVTTSKGDSILTKGNILNNSESTISVLNDLSMNRINTALHTMMLAFGFEHGESSVAASQTLNFKEHLSSFAKIRKIVLQSCSIDKLSVMSAYSNAKMEMKDKVKIWSFDKLVQTKPKEMLQKCLGELDKVALNIVYPPIKIPGKYDPELQSDGLYYCSRKVMKNHNRPNKDVIDDVWQRKSGPNCPACRTFSSDKMNELNGKGIFQALSGMVYWGQKIENRGRDKVDKWSPENPLPCNDCLEIFYDKETIRKLIRKHNNCLPSWVIF